MNNFLNEAVKASMPQTNQGRIPLSYAHKKERDTFYEISPSELPPVAHVTWDPALDQPTVCVLEDLDELVRSGSPFCRKVDSVISAGLMDALDQRIRVGA